MATKLKDMPKRRGRATKHDWANWADGSVWKVKRGEDFDAELESFRTQLYGKAKTLGKTIQVDVDRAAETIVFRMTDKPASPTDG